MPTYNRASTLRLAIESVLAQSHQNWELLITDDGSTDETESVVTAFASDPRIRYFKTDNQGVSAARNHSLSRAQGSLVAYLDSDNTWNAEYLRLMVIEILSGEVDCAYSAVRVVDASGATVFYRGDEFDWEQCRQANYIDINALVHRRSLVDGGFEPKLRRMVDWDFILRITRDARTVYVPFLGCRYVASHEDPLRITRREPEVWAEVIRTRHADDGTLVPWDEVADRLKLTFSLKIAAPRDQRQEWGDFHFANSLANAMESLGHEVRIDFREDWDTGRRNDVNIALRGLKEFHPQRGVINVLWNISHPDHVTRSELLDYDIVYSASRSHTLMINLDLGEHGPYVRTLMQCTDEELFNPDKKEQPSPHSADLLFVGNSRADFRPMVKWALEADLDIRVVGKGWSHIIEDRRIQNMLIDNDALGAAYANSRVVLGDHWPSMRDFGIISNRVFDVAATGTRLISDRQPALDSVFGPIVDQVGSAEELRSAAYALGPPAEDRLKLAQWVITHHTFSDRARTIVNDVLAYLNLPQRYDTDSDTRSSFMRDHGVGRVKVGILVPRGPNGADQTTHQRLISPLSTEHACNRLDVVAVETTANLEDLDVLILQSPSGLVLDGSKEIVQEARARGVTVIVDVAGAPAWTESHTPARGPHPALRAAQSVWFSTKALQQSFPGSPDHSTVVPDSIDPRIWRHYARSTDIQPIGHGSPRLLLLAPAGSDDDFDLVYQALHQLSHRFSFELFVVGDISHDAPDESWLTISSVPPEASSHRAFTKWLAEQGPFDIGLIPRSDTPSSRMKSDRDFLDFSALGLLSVLSDLPPYTEVVKDRELGVTTGEDGWLGALTEIFESPERFEAMKERAHGYVWSERTVDLVSKILVSEIEDVVTKQRGNRTSTAPSPGAS